MSIASESLANLKTQIAAGFKICGHELKDGIHHFILPSLEGDYSICVPDNPQIRAFIESIEFTSAVLHPVEVAVALLDIVGFSGQPDDIQLKMIVRYQCLVREALKGSELRRLISIGDGTIFVFDGANKKHLPEWLFAIDHALAGFNLDFKGNDVPEINWRMGVHVGSAYLFKDINGQENYIGTGVNLAQRVSTCVPDPEQPGIPPELNSTIYVSQAARSAFMAAGADASFQFYDAGDCTVKKTHVGHVYAMHKITDA